MRLLLSLLLAGAMQVNAAAAEPAKRALVLANSAYASGPLKNPRADAALIANALRDTGFTVEQRAELDRAALFAAVRAFADGLPEGAIALVYYAGHGMQVGGTNYLVPVDMQLSGEASVAGRAFAATTLVDSIQQSKAGVGVIVLDACRNNPFRPVPAKATRSLGDLGLARVVTPRGMLIAYSTAPGQLAEDGGGRNSLYSEALAGELRKRGQTIEQALKNVGDAVRRKTFDDQQPWFESSLVDDLFFVPPPGVTVAAAQPRARRAATATIAARSRGSESQQSDWFAPLSGAQWQQLDREITRRAERMTPDEIPALERRASTDSVVAQTTLGVLYRIGPLRADSQAQGSGRLAQAATLTSRSGANNTLALHWLRKAADRGFLIAQVELGEMYYEGRGVDRDLLASRRWLEAAAASGYPRARINLAQLDAEAGGSAQDYLQLMQEMLRATQEMNGAQGVSASPTR